MPQFVIFSTPFVRVSLHASVYDSRDIIVGWTPILGSFSFIELVNSVYVEQLRTVTYKLLT